MDKNQVFDKYKRLGIVTLFPLAIIGYFSLYVFSQFYKMLARSSFPEYFTWKTTIGMERIMGILFFLVLFSGISSAILSSISFWIAGHKKDEKWLRRAQNLRIFPWVLVMLFALALVGMIVSIILRRL